MDDLAVTPGKGMVVLVGAAVVSTALLFCLPSAWSLGLILCLVAVLVAVSSLQAALFLVILTVAEDMTALILERHSILDGVSQFVSEVRFYVFYVPLLAGLVSWAVCRAANRIPPRERTPIDGVLLFIVGYEWLSLFWGWDFLYTFAVALNLLANWLLYLFITALIRDRKSLVRAAKFWVWSGVIGAAGIYASQWIDIDKQVSIARDFFLNIEFGIMANRPSGFAGHNHIAGYVGMAMAVSAGLALDTEKRRGQWLYALLAVFMLSGVILTESRGALIGVVGGAIFLAAVHPVLRRRFLTVSATFLLVVVLTIFAVTPGLIDRLMMGFGYTGKLYFSPEDAYFTRTEDVGTGAVSTLDRVGWWMDGLNEMRRHPWKLVVGLGIGNFTHYASGSPDSNSVLGWFFLDMGLVGIVVLAVLGWIFLRHVGSCLIAKTGARSYSLFLGAVTALVLEPGIHGLIELDWTMIGSRLIWLPLAFAMAATHVVGREQPEPSAGP